MFPTDPVIFYGFFYTMDTYELHQKSCKLPVEEKTQIKTFFQTHLIDYLKNMRAFDGVLRMNVIGSPSDAGIVFKVLHKELGCFALKIMPYTLDAHHNENELKFSQLLSDKFPTRFAVVYYQTSHLRFDKKRRTPKQRPGQSGIIDVPVADWYMDSDAKSSKIEKHLKLYNDVVQYNIQQKRSMDEFECDILISRLYWGDFLAFIHSDIKPAAAMGDTTLSRRCDNVDQCHILREMKNDVHAWKRILIRLIDSIKKMRELNIIHGDLHCGNVLLEFDGTPIIHDFGTTRFYSIPKTETQLFYGDTVDFRKLVNALALEVSNNNTAVGKYLRQIAERTNAYVETLYNTHMPLSEIGLHVINDNDQTSRTTLEDQRRTLWTSLKSIVNADVEEHDGLSHLLQTLTLSPNISKEEFAQKRRDFIRTPHYETYKKAKELLDSNTGGRRRRRRRTRRN